jgi:hypothetical protein
VAGWQFCYNALENYIDGVVFKKETEPTMECNKDKNLDRKGLCCECLSYHLSSRQLPGCCFPPEVEETYDRSFRAFAKAWNL